MFRVIWSIWKRRHVVHSWSARFKAMLFFVLLIWYATSGFLYFELPGKPDLSWLDGLWWAVVTMATVGYGDLFPVSSGGRYLVGIPAMVFGIGFLGYLISETSSSLLEYKSMRLRGMRDQKMRDHVLLFHFPNVDVVMRLVKELKGDSATSGKGICLVDETLEELPKELQDAGLEFVRGDSTREEVLERANVKQASQALVLVKNPRDPHSDDHNLVTTLVLERMHPGIHTVVEVINPHKIHQMSLAGANSVICASDLTSGLMVQELSDPGVKDVIMDLVSDMGGNQIYIIPIQAMRTWQYDELVAWGCLNQITVVGLRRRDQQMINPSRSEKICADDMAILISSWRLEQIDTTSPSV